MRGTQPNGGCLSHLTHVVFHFRPRVTRAKRARQVIGTVIEMLLDFQFDPAKGSRILRQPLLPLRLTSLRRGGKIIHHMAGGTNHRPPFLQADSHGGLLPVVERNTHNMVGDQRFPEHALLTIGNLLVSNN